MRKIKKEMLAGNYMGKEMIYAPVMITACNRYKHLERCIGSLQRNGYAKDTELYISVDFPLRDPGSDDLLSGAQFRFLQK